MILRSLSSIGLHNHRSCFIAMSVHNSSAFKNILRETVDTRQKRGSPLLLIINITGGGETDKARVSQ